MVSVLLADPGAYAFIGANTLIYKGPITTVDVEISVELDRQIDIAVETSPQTT